MPRNTKGDGRGLNPNSRKNLIHTGRPSSEEVYGEPSKNHTVTVTDTGWNGLKDLVRQAGYSGVSEFLEYVGRGNISIPEKMESGEVE